MIKSKFITRKEEVTAVMPVAASIDHRELYPYLFKIEEKVLRKLLGLQLDALAADYEVYRVNNYDPTFLNQFQIDLLIRIQMAAVNLAIRAWAPYVIGQISTKGITEANSDQKSAKESTIERILDAALADGNESIEMMLAQLSENYLQYPSWTDSSAFLDFHGQYVTTAMDFNEYVSIGESRYTFVSMAPQRREAERTVDRIICELGPEIKSQRASNTLTISNATLLELVKKAVANLSMADALLMLGFQFSDYGVSVMATSTASSNVIRVKQPVGDNKLAQIRTECQQKGQAALIEIRDLIYQNIDDYPTFRDGQNYTPTAPAPEAFKNINTDKIVIF